MEGLDLDNILDDDALSLFNDNGKQEVSTPEKTDSIESEKKENNNDITENTSDKNLFEGSESVGDGNNYIEEKDDTSSEESESTSPKNDFFSSIAEAFAEEGILPNLDDETIKNIRTPEDFRKAVDDYIKSELTEQQQRVKEALDNDVEPDAIKQYENVLGYLNSLDEDNLKAESDQGEELRKRIIYQDYINRGFDAKRAEKEVTKSLDNGTDLEDALDALDSCKDYYKNSYNKLLEDAKKNKQREEKNRENKANELKEAIFNKDNKFFGDMDLDKSMRQKIYDNISKPVYKDSKTGEAYTAIQRYEMEHGDEFLVKLGLLFTLTDGFKSLDNLVAGKVKKGIKRGLRDLEGRINSTSRDAFGNLKYTSGVSDGESYLGKGIKLAL